MIWEGFNDLVNSFFLAFHESLKKHDEAFKEILKIERYFWHNLSELLQIASQNESLLKFLASNNQFKESELAVENIERYYFESLVGDTRKNW